MSACVDEQKCFSSPVCESRPKQSEMPRRSGALRAAEPALTHTEKQSFSIYNTHFLKHSLCSAGSDADKCSQQSRNLTLVLSLCFFSPQTQI